MRERVVAQLFYKWYLSSLKRKAGVSKILQFEERFRKAPFTGRISVDGTPNRRNKTPFSNSSGVVCAGPGFPDDGASFTRFFIISRLSALTIAFLAS